MVSVESDRVNGLTASVAAKAPVVCATTANITLSGLQTVDGVTVAAGDRVLVKNQTNAVENGIYEASTSSWVRARDFNGTRDVVKGTQVRVAGGTTQTGAVYYVSSENTITVGTSEISFLGTVGFSISSQTIPTYVQQAYDWLATEEMDNNEVKIPNAARRQVVETSATEGGAVTSQEYKDQSLTALALSMRAILKFQKRYGEDVTALFYRLWGLAQTQQETDPDMPQYGAYYSQIDFQVCNVLPNSQLCLALCDAYRMYRDKELLEAAKRIGDFLLVLYNPNTRYQALYGVNPLTGGAYGGFCDEINVNGAIRITSSGTSAMAMYALRDLADLTGDSTYSAPLTLAKAHYLLHAQTVADYYAPAGPVHAQVTLTWQFASQNDYDYEGLPYDAETGPFTAGQIVTETTSTETANIQVVEDNGTDGYLHISNRSGAMNDNEPITDPLGGAATVDGAIETMAAPGSNDNAFHRRGENLKNASSATNRAFSGLIINTVGSDQIEYPLEALYGVLTAEGGDTTDLSAAFDAANVSVQSFLNGFFSGSPTWGDNAYDPDFSWSGFFRWSSAWANDAVADDDTFYGSTYDVQHIGTVGVVRHGLNKNFAGSASLRQNFGLHYTALKPDRTVSYGGSSGAFTASRGTQIVAGLLLVNCETE